MRIAFVWQGFSGRYGQWSDGLYWAMKEIEKTHAVGYFDTDQIRPLHDFNPDMVLYWEAPVTINGKDRDNYINIQTLPYKKALLFAGGQIKKEWVDGFDLLFVESRINEEECEALGIPWRRAFGVNADMFKPERQPKVFDAAYQGTCALWKRQSLFSRAVRDKGVVCGRFQESDPIGFLTCRENGTLVLPELSYPGVAALLNSAHTVVNCADLWGGGQRCSLEAMACGIPLIVMSDSPKNREFVEASGAGLIVDPDENKIREAIEQIKAWTPAEKERGVAYVRENWTAEKYADAIMSGLYEF